MLFLLCGSIGLALLWFLLGRVFLAMAGVRTAPDVESPEWTMLLGAFVMAAVSQAVHFFLPLPSGASAVALIAGLFALCLLRPNDAMWLVGECRRAIGRHPLLCLVLIGLSLLIVLSAARPSRIEDTVASHAQILRWTDAARTLPGLALVHSKLGFNSLWFPLEAVCAFAFLGRGPLPLANVTTFLIGWVLLFRLAFSTTRSRLLSSLAVAMLLPYGGFGFLFAGSLSNDLPVLTFGLLACLAAVRAIESTRVEHEVLAVGLASAAVCWKLSAMPLLLLVPGLLWNRMRSGSIRIERAWVTVALLAVTAGALLVGRSVVLSGYPIYPTTLFDAFDVDWKAPASVAYEEEIWVRAWARGLFAGHPSVTLRYPLRQWMPIWVQNWTPLARFFFPLAGAAVVLFALSWFIRPARAWVTEGHRRALALAWSVVLASTAFWFWQAPDVRFGAPYLTTLFALLCLPWIWMFDRVRPLVAGLALIGAAALVAQNVARVNPVPPWCPASYARAYPGRVHAWLPAPYPEATFVEERLSDGSINHVLVSGLPGYAPVPNSRTPLAGYAVMRGPRLGDGYRLQGGRVSFPQAVERDPKPVEKRPVPLR